MSKSAMPRTMAAPDLLQGRPCKHVARCVTMCRAVAQERAGADDQPMTSHISLRVPNDLVEAFDRIASALERPRSWVILRALRQYLENEGREVEQDTESIAELDRGEIVPAEELHHRLRKIIAKSERARAREK